LDSPALHARSGAAAVGSRWRGLVVPAALALAALALYRCTQQSYYYGDGRGLISKANAGIWVDHNLGYFPLVQLARATLTPLLGADAESPMRWLSAGSTALAIGVLAAALRRTGVGLLTTTLVAALIALTPVVWFHATCVEVLAPHLLAASFAFYGLASRAAVDRLRGDALVPALAGALLFASHMSGALWAPALAWIAWRRGGWVLPARLWPALAIAALVPFAWWRLSPSPEHGSSLIGLALQNLFGARDSTAFTEEWLRPLALLAPLAMIGAVRLVLRGRGGVAHRHAATANFPTHSLSNATSAAAVDASLALPACIAITTYLCVVSSMSLRERGAYYVGLVPWLAWAGARAFEQLRGANVRRVGTVVLSACVLLQARRGFAFASELDHVDPALAWIDSAKRELGPSGIVLTRTQDERVAVLAHSRLECFALHAPEGLNLGLGDLAGPSGRDIARQIVQWAHATQRRIAIARTLLEAPDAAAVLEGIGAQPEALQPGAMPEYVLLRPVQPP
jgi:hypothetical protein